MIYYKAVWAFLPFGFERKNGMIVLGIDPGYAIVGYGVVEMKITVTARWSTAR